MDKILVTGATGNLGYNLAVELKKENINFKCTAHNVEKAQSLLGKDIEIVKFDFLNPLTYDEALKDVTKIFLMRPPELANPKKEIIPFLKRAEESGVKHTVFVSLMGVDKNPVVPHRKIEDYIKSRENLSYTFLRPSFFMQNLSTTHKEEIKVLEKIIVPVGKAKTSFIDTKDISEVALKCLLQDTHKNKEYTLTGSEALDYYEIAEIMSEVLERKITYANPSFLEFRRQMLNKGIKKDFVNVMMALYAVTRFGGAKGITNELENLLERKPTTFKEFCIENKNTWI